MATDLAGKSAQATVPVMVSNSSGATSPTVVITVPAAGATVSGTVPVTANATDNGGVASVVFQADGKQIGSPVTASPYAVSLNTDAAEQGSAHADGGGDGYGWQECSGFGHGDGQ